METPPPHDLAAELLRRRDADQALRRLLPDTGPWPDDLVERVRETDADTTAFLRRVLDAHGWPGISLVGAEAADAAWLLAQHADEDPAFQRRALALVERAVATGDAPPRHLAYLTDRCLVAEGRPQTYGTQYFDDGCGLRPRPIADPEGLDARRAAVGLEPHAAYDARHRRGRP